MALRILRPSGSIEDNGFVVAVIALLETMMHGWGGFGGLGGGYPVVRRFEEQYHCYSVAYADKAHLEVRRGRSCCCVLLELRLTLVTERR